MVILHVCTGLYVCTCTMVFKAMFTTDIYGRVRMHVYMHLVFKEFIDWAVMVGCSDVLTYAH